MYAIVGASGRLGRATTELLLAEGREVRLLVRDPAKVADFAERGAKVMRADVMDRKSLERACAGVRRLFTTVHAFDGGAEELRAVEHHGNRSLINAARLAGVEHFVFTSVLGARADHPVDFFREKFFTEQYLKTSGMSWTILRPAAYMEHWAELVGQPVVRTGRTTLYGRGDNPVNFVAVSDVACFAVLALDDPRARNAVLEIGGPENLSLRQLVEIFERRLGRRARVRRLPLPVLRAIYPLMRGVRPGLARQIATGILMDSTSQAFDPGPTLRTFPVPLTRLEDLVERTVPAAQVRG